MVFFDLLSGSNGRECNLSFADRLPPNGGRYIVEVQYSTLSRGREGECDSSMIGPNGIDNRGLTLIDNLLQWPSNFMAKFKEAGRQISSHSP